MTSLHKSLSGRNRKAQAGMTLVETMVALAILLICAAGLLSFAGVAISTTENQGHLAARTAEYAEDKMEQLLALAYCDGGTTGTTGTDTTVFPGVALTGTGLAGCASMGTPLTSALGGSGGSLSTSSPTSGYVDYLDASGNLVSASANWEYIRVWQISLPSGTHGLKQISVKVQVAQSVGAQGLLPQSTVTALKSYLF
jgi:prepilin-type N-terminal cleavage/methylation domain-containing protein